MEHQPDPVIPVPNDGWDERVRVFRYGEIADSFAVITERYLVLIDTLATPSAPAAILQELEAELAHRTLLVVNTHGDYDHAWGNGLFVGADAQFPAPVIGSRIIAERMASENAEKFIAEFLEQHPGRYPGAALIPPTIQIDGSARIDGGDLTLELLPTPGHTPDHIAIWIPGIRTLLAGDAAESPLPFVGDESVLPELRASLARMVALRPDRVLYCHAAGRSDPGVIERNITYFDELERRCREAGPTSVPEDPVEALGWTLEAAVTDLFPPEAHERFYRDAHAQAIRAMLAWLAEDTATPARA